MTDSSVAGLCRLTVRAPSRTIDLAVPGDVPVADLLPTVLRYAGEETEETGLEHDGWVLQRLGDTPLEDEATVDAMDLRDGEVLYLRPHNDAMPEVRIDDLVDGIAVVTQEGLHGWTSAAGRRLLLGMTVAALTLGLLVLTWPGGPAGPRIVTAGAAGLLLLAGAASASRAVGDAAAAATLGFMATPFLAVAGWLMPGGEIAGPHGYQVVGARLLAASAAGAGGAVLALALTAVRTPLFVAAALVAVTGALAGGLMSVFDVAADGAAATVASLAVLLGGFVPTLSFKLAGMRMPPLPTNPQQLQEGIEPYNGTEVTTRTEFASGWMTGLYAASGVLCAGCLVPLANRPALSEALTAGVLALLLLVHGRGMVNTWQRLALVLPGAWGAAVLLLALAKDTAPADRPVLVALLLALATILAVASWTVPGRRMLPYWGRAAEILQSLLAIALLPLTLWVLGIFAALRALNG
ncbi:type VII secretion integral membrane protein EccD [Streptomyces sp. NPDC088354]|uniref:type VII secretion integral membrane protein EccD n=1 Tax=Streptomyces sp. NPDC088354 TaxID=3365856 RepID=UPI00380ED73C